VKYIGKRDKNIKKDNTFKKMGDKQTELRGGKG